MKRVVSGFVAFPSSRPSLVETIEGAITSINSGGTVSLESWQAVSRAGRVVIANICDAIAQCQLFMCDLTELNSNVLFELGYAIVKVNRPGIAGDRIP